MDIIRASMLAALLVPLALAQADELQPCGTITSSIRLKRDCLAPMIIASDNITVNLNGHTIHGVPALRSGSIDVVERRGVTIKNGTVRSATAIDDRYGLNVVFGGGHTFRDLTFENLAVRIKEVDDTVVKRLWISASQNFPNASRSSFNFVGTNSKIMQVRATGVLSSGGVIAGEALVIADNDFKSESLCGLYVATVQSTVKGNAVKTAATDARLGGLCATGYTTVIKRNTILGLATGLILPSTADGFLIRNNYIRSSPSVVPDALDIRAGINACTNTWKNNDFNTDSEGDGPDAGCIR
jgi:hypothetical protein